MTLKQQSFSAPQAQILTNYVDLRLNCLYKHNTRLLRLVSRYAKMEFKMKHRKIWPAAPAQVRAIAAARSNLKSLMSAACLSASVALIISLALRGLL